MLRKINTLLAIFLSLLFLLQVHATLSVAVQAQISDTDCGTTGTKYKIGDVICLATQRYHLNKCCWIDANGPNLKSCIPDGTTPKPGDYPGFISSINCSNGDLCDPALNPAATCRTQPTFTPYPTSVLFDTPTAAPVVGFGRSSDGIPIPTPNCGYASSSNSGTNRCCPKNIDIAKIQNEVNGFSGVPVVGDIAQSLVNKTRDAANSQFIQTINPPCFIGGPTTNPTDLDPTLFPHGLDPAKYPDSCICGLPRGSNEGANKMIAICKSFIKQRSGTVGQAEREEKACEKCAVPDPAHLDRVGIWTGLGCIPTDLPSFIGNFLLRIGIGFAGVVAFGCIIYSAFIIQTSAGSPEKIKKAQETLTSCISGLVLIIFSVFILKLIGVDILRIPGFS